MAYEVGAGITIGGILKGLAAVATVGGAVTSGVQGQQASNRGKQGLRNQEQAQDQAQAAALSQRRENDIAQRRANRKTPDIAAILAGNQSAGGGIGSTDLTGGLAGLGSNTSLGQGGRV